MLKNFTPRLYQETIFATASLHHTLVVLPTGLGKTGIALMLASHRLQQYPHSKILILAPTKPLVDQHVETLRNHLSWGETDLQNDLQNQEKIVLFTGAVSPEKRAELWKSAKIIVSTPQGLENDVISRRISLEDVSLLVFDEAHRAVGDYSYVWLAKRYDTIARWPRILALTASPGDDLEKIQELLTNLFIQEIEVRVEHDPDVKPYVQEVDIQWVEVAFPEELKQVHTYLKSCFLSKVKEIQQYGHLNGSGENKMDILKLQGHLQGEIASGNRDPELLRSISLAAEALKVQHALELVETQGVEILKQYLEDLVAQSRTTKIKAVQNLVRDLYFRSALAKVKLLVEQKIEHPKFQKLSELIQHKSTTDYKIIVFCQYRNTGSKIVDLLNQLPGIQAQLFIGQAKKNNMGLTQKEQIQMLSEFRSGKFNVLVSSSVGEEGLDIPQVDLVIFYEPTPSAIRHIQRKGRTGRAESGEVIILVTKGTRDQGYRWSAHHKEQRMYRTLKTLKKSVLMKSKPSENLQQFLQDRSEKKIEIIADYREKGSGVLKELIELGCLLRLEKLESADYLLSDRVGAEFKLQDDFVDSLLDGRLLKQAKFLKENFPRPLLIVEGDRDLFSLRNVHPNALRGALASLALDFCLPILYTKYPKDTASVLFVIARREQLESAQSISLHGDRKPGTLKELQEYIVAALPGVGGKLAVEILKKFKTIRGIASATEEELKEIPLIGEKKARQIREILDKEYKEYE